jgi:hypothetical protein
VGHAQAALERAEATVTTARQRAAEAIETQRFHLQAPRVPTPEGAQDALATLAKRWTYQQGESSPLIAPKRSAGKGRPPPSTPLQASAWHIQARGRPDQEALGYRQHVKAGFVLGTNIGVSQWSDAAGIAASNSQSCVEGGCRLLQDPLFCVSSLFVKKPRRIEGLVMVMPLAWLVDSVAQRRMRQPWARRNETVPHHIHHPTASPT